ncbi:MAG: group I intron-associated PD-(D/E)XK endonuclease [Pseudomonadota bacterium]|nr:group I intron-associated PD-(D/E)XK endonuclease [Pseudomonadota bacterium]
MGEIGITQNSAKQTGVTGELLFAYRAMEEGLTVAQPLGDNSPYDFLVDNGEDILKVQIKSSESNEHENKPHKSAKYGFTLKHSKQDKIYEAHDVDFFGLVVIPLRSIWIVPQKAIDRITKVNVYPIGNSSGYMADYREQWILLKSYSEYSEVTASDHCHQVTFL